MSLTQKYTWHDFLKDHPEHKEKKTKRTSTEGKKAFEAAHKAFIKKYLSERAEKISKLAARSQKRRETMTKKVSEFRKSKKWPKAKLAQAKAGRADHTIAELQKLTERTKAALKDF